MRSINISQNIVSLSDFKNKASKMLHEIQISRRPIVITQNGKTAAVLISPSDFDLLTEQARFVETVQTGFTSYSAVYCRRQSNCGQTVGRSHTNGG